MLVNQYAIAREVFMKKVLLCMMLSLLAIPKVYAGYEHVQVQLKWKHGFQFAGFYMALEKGFYRNSGLDVSLIEGGPNKSPVDSVLRHSATYGVASTGALIEHSIGRPIQAIAAIFQYSPLAIMVKEDTDIQSFADLNGKRVMLQKGYLNAGIIAALQKAGVGEQDFVRQDISYNILDFLENRTDAYAVYATDQPYELNVKGIPYRILGLQEQGIELYGDIIITSEEEIGAHAARVQAFIDATSLGWQYAFEHTNESIDLILEKYNTQHLTRNHLQSEAQISMNFILPDVVKPGYMNMFRWNKIAKIYSEQGFLPPNYPVEDFVYLPRKSLSDFIKAHLWQLLLVAMVLLVIFFAVNVFALQRLVKRKTAALEASEKSAESLLEALDIGVVVHKGGCLLYANPYAMTCFQVDSSEDLYQKNVLQFVHPDDRESAKKRLHNNKFGLHGNGRVPMRYVGEHGRKIDAEVGSMSFVFHGEPAVLTIIHDVTERNLRLMADAKIQKQMEQMQRLESMGVMAGGIAHDFNNLLAVILGHADMALYNIKEKPDAVEKSLGCIIQASENAGLLCKQMLAYSGKGKFVVEPIKLSETVNGMLGLIDVATGKDTRVIYEVDDVSMVKGDSSQLQQVVMNLLTNAAEAIEHKYGEIKLHVFEVDVDDDYLAKCHHDKATIGRYVCLEVSDNGCGMSAKVKNKIFEPFYTTKFTGRGLGMSAILGITLGHRGVLDIESVLGKGTVIRVLLPCYESAGVVSAGSVSKADVGSDRFIATVLLVDDEKQVLLMAREMMESLGLKVITACNGKKALQIYTECMEDIDLVMLDLTMPGMNGNDTYIALRSLNKNVKVLICSGYAEDAVKKEFCQLEPLTFVAKPYQRSVVCSALSKLLV